MLKYCLLSLLLVSLSATNLENEKTLKSFWIIWNVGQGQWSTLVHQNSCDHFDMGGERSPLRQVQKVCGDKNNRVYLSHWDWDHVSFAIQAKTLLKKICLSLPPLGVSSAYKMKILQTYKSCSSQQKSPTSLQELTQFTNQDLHKKSNDLSHVLLAMEQFLIPGDSTAAQEKIWSQQVPLKKVKFLLLGHHGSRTSTSAELVDRLPNLQVAVASARFARYGHPHAEVVRRLQRHQVILLKTEDWGNLWFEMTP